MGKFCGKCGAKLDEKTGLCPNCDAEKIKQQVDKTVEPAQKSEEKVVQHKKEPANKKEARKQRKVEKKAAKKAKKKAKQSKPTTEQKIRRFFLKFFALVVALLTIAGGIAGTLVYFGLADIPFVNDAVVWGVKQKESKDITKSLEDEKEVYMVEPIDAENYFAENSSIISSVEVNSSNIVKTEADAYNLLTSLGFFTYEITTEYSMDGTYHSAVGINETSNEKHPTYQTYYVSENGEIWTILLIGDVIMANPVSYNIQSERDVSVMFSETKSIMGYDSATNKFFQTIPNESTLIVKVIDTINSDTLENLTIEVIDSYE